MRRKFDEALKIILQEGRADSLALSGKRHCGGLFELERNFASLTPAERFEKRQKVSKTLLEAFFAWAETCGAIPKTPVGKVVHYALSQRKYLERYLLSEAHHLDLQNPDHMQRLLTQYFLTAAGT